VEGKSLVRQSAAIPAEYKSREAVRTPPLKWSTHAELAGCHSRNTLDIKNAFQVGGDPRSEFFDVDALWLSDTSNAVE
jgi:hypothetical protein